MKKFFLLVMMALVMGVTVSCNNDDENQDVPGIVNPAPKEQWSKTMRGDNQSIRAFPDIFANYWEYTFDAEKHPNIGFRLTGSFPEARFFNFTIYDDLKMDDVSALEDVDIKQDADCVNPYVTATDKYGDNKYTIYVIPANTPAASRTAMKNVCEFPETLKMVSIFMRLYLAQQYAGDEYGGVDMPAIQAFDVMTGEDVAFPKREDSQINHIPDVPSMNFTDAQKALPFMRAPINMWYPNAPADYLFTRVKLNADSVAIFNFIPPVSPASVTDYPKADVRYWSICLGATTTLSYVSSYDSEMPKRDSKGFVTIIIADENSSKLADIRKKAEGIDGTYVLTWNREEWGDGILALYRNMVINETYGHSMTKQMDPITMDMANGDLSSLNPMKMIAILAMGNWGPHGMKFSENDYLDGNFNYSAIRSGM